VAAIVLATIHPDWTGSPQHFAAGLILTAVIALGLRRFVAWKGWQVAAATLVGAALAAIALAFIPARRY
jgi:hypothetical protein